MRVAVVVYFSHSITIDIVNAVASSSFECWQSSSDIKFSHKKATHNTIDDGGGGGGNRKCVT